MFLCWHDQSLFILFLDVGLDARTPEAFSTNKRRWSCVVTPFQNLGSSQNDVLCLSAPGGQPVPCHPGRTINKMWGVPEAERPGWLWRHHFAWMWVPCYLALFHTSSSSVFPMLLFLLFFSLLLIQLSNNPLICSSAYSLITFIHLSLLSLIVWLFFGALHLIKILCGWPYLEIGWRAFFCLGIQVLIYTICGHPCDISFSSFFQGSVPYFIPVVVTHKP